MNAARAEAVRRAVEWLIVNAPADAMLTVSRAPIANGATVSITVRAYVPDATATDDGDLWQTVVAELL